MLESTATISPELCCAASAAAATAWSWLSMVVRTGVPACPAMVDRVATVWPAALTTTMEVLGVPASVSW